MLPITLPQVAQVSDKVQVEQMQDFALHGKATQTVLRRVKKVNETTVQLKIKGYNLCVEKGLGVITRNPPAQPH